jgi:hypothetical protein
VLESGTHVLTRFAEDGTTTETRTLEVLDRRWMLADRRARLPGQAGSWLHFDDPVLGAWWVPESAHAHATGQTEDALLADRARVTLSRTAYPLIGLAMPGSQPGDRAEPSDEVTVTVDRRRVVDGRTYLRLADTRSAGSWVEVAPGVASTESGSQRVLAREPRDGEAEVRLGRGEHIAFRFDAHGQVVDRRPVVPTPGGALTTGETIVVNDERFLVIAGGELAGWALAQTDDVSVLEGSAATAGRE